MGGESRLARIIADWRRLTPFVALALIIGSWWASLPHTPPTALAAGRGVAGRVLDSYDQPISRAALRLYADEGTGGPIAETESQPDGAYLLILPEGTVATNLYVEVERPHFATAVWRPTREELSVMLAEGSFVTHDVVLERRISAGFWVAAALFVGMLALVAMERLHTTLAALLALVILFAVSAIGGAITPELFIYDFEQALEYVDFDVIFLLLGMMIVIGVMEGTGIFQWLAFRAYRLSRGKVWLLMLILMGITLVTSSMLDNVITMLLITPITLEIALALRLRPMSLLIPALLSANVGGMTTLVGTPVNIIVGSYAGIGFNAFAVNMAPGVLMMEAGLIAFALFHYRKEVLGPKRRVSAALVKRLERDGQIQDKVKLRKAGLVFAGLLLLFIFGEPIHITPPVAALIGAVVMLIWVHPDIVQMMGVVDWTTLIFFIALFMVVGALQEVGVLALAAGGISTLVGENALVAMLVIVGLSALLSGVVDNIPFAAAMLPVAGLLARTVPGAQ